MILIGSTCFFGDIENFHSKDRDFLEIVKVGNGFNHLREIHTKNYCKFTLVNLPKNELIKRALEHGPAMQVGKFLVPEVANFLGMTIDDLKCFKPLIDKLDKKHEY